MPKWPKTSILLLILLPVLAGCGQSDQDGPPSTDTSSTSIPALEDRIEFLESYLTFKRQYEQLEFHITYHNNSSGFLSLPAPSDWYIRVVAKVPPADLLQWTGGMQALTDDDQLIEEKQWTLDVAQEIDVSEIDSWFKDRGKLVGVDEKNSIVAYRLTSGAY